MGVGVALAFRFVYFGTGQLYFFLQEKLSFRVLPSSSGICRNVTGFLPSFVRCPVFESGHFLDVTGFPVIIRDIVLLIRFPKVFRVLLGFYRVFLARLLMRP